MTQFASPVLHSLLDTDAYKLHMQQAVFHHYYDVHVAAEFRCRGDDLLGIYADAIREQIQAMQHLRLPHCSGERLQNVSPENSSTSL